jgi:hypothetical protein
VAPSRQGLILIVSGSLALGLLLVLQFFSSTPSDVVRQQIGEISEVVGLGQLHRDRSTRSEDLVKGLAVRDGDIIETRTSAFARAQLKVGGQVRVAQGTRVRVELWDPSRNDSPLLLVLEEGQIDLKDTTRGRLLVVNNGQLQPGLNAYYTAESFKMTPALGQTQTFSDTPSPSEDQTGGRPAPRARPAAELTDPSTLSNDVIRSRLSDFAADFERCRANRVRVSGPQAGQVLLGYAILPDGKTAEVKVIQTEMRDTALLDCLRRVLTSVRFPSFRGQKIYSSHLLRFR